MAGGGEPMAAVVFGILLFSEMPTTLNLTGLAITIFALYMLCKPQKQLQPIDIENDAADTQR